MNNKFISLIVAGVILVTVVLTWFLMSVNYNNGYTRLEKQAQAEQNVSKLTFDTTWKIIQSQAQIADKERESFRDVFVDIMNSRSQNEQNLVMKWAQEAQVPITPELYRKVQDSVEIQRTKFLDAQKKLVDIKREADTMKDTFPGSLFLSGRKSIEIKVVTSSKTEETFSTGKEDDINLFKE